MTHTEAAEILRGKKGASMRNIFESERMGAEALEFQAWLFELINDGYIRVVAMYERWHGEDSFLDYCREEWRREKDNGR